MSTLVTVPTKHRYRTSESEFFRLNIGTLDIDHFTRIGLTLVMISSDLKSSNQCIQACSKASKMLGMIKRIISYKSPDIMVRLYKTLVRPHLEYCVSMWSPHYTKD